MSTQWTGAGEPTPVAVMSESAAGALFPGEDPIGKRFYRWRSADSAATAPRFVVVGVVRDAFMAGRVDSSVGTSDIYFAYQQDSLP